MIEPDDERDPWPDTYDEAVTHTEAPPASSASPWASGSHFSSYEIDSRLASGGMAEVWRAKIKGFEGFEKRIVIKTMLTQHRRRPDLVEMFIAEASLAARLSHPSIVDVIDFGELEGRYFIAMEYVPGVTLRFAHKRAAARGETLPPAFVLHVMRDICEALDYMHQLEDGGGSLGLLHRDLSPDNIIVSTSGAAKLIDFGAARATARTPPSSAFVGKFRYAAPERIRQDGEDRRSDVYSAGVILYECLTGVRPFDGTDAAVVRAVTSNVVRDPRERVPSLPAPVAAVVLRAMAFDPADRFDSAWELGAALARSLVELGATSRERDVTSALSELLDGPPLPTPGPDPLDGDVTDAVPQALEASQPSSDAIVLSEREIIEASGPIPALLLPLVGGGADTERISLPLPPEAFRPPTGERTFRTPTGEAPFRTPTGEGAFRTPTGDGIPLRKDGIPTVPTVSIFVRGGSRRRSTPSNPASAIPGAVAAGGSAGVLEWRSAPPTPPGGAPAPTDRAVELFDRGLKLRIEGRYGEALHAWELALAHAPDNLLYQSHVRRLREQLGLLRAPR